MALTISRLRLDYWGSTPVAIITAQPAASDYVTAGYSITPSVCGFGAAGSLTVALVSVGSPNSTPVTTAVLPYWDQVNQKLQVYESPAVASTPSTAAAFSEVANGGDLSGWLFTLLVLSNQ